MPHFLRNRQTAVSIFKELGCGLLTMIAFTAPLWAFSMATRGPRFAFTLLAGAVVVAVLVLVVSRALRRR